MQESLLRQVARLLRVFRQTVEQRVDVRVPLLDETVEGRRVARLEPFKELRLRRRLEAVFDGGCRVGSPLQFRSNAEGDWLSEAHRLPPSDWEELSKGQIPFN